MKCFARINKYIVTHMNPESNNDKHQDDYVTKCMGAFGYYQALMCPISSAVRLMVVWNIVSIVFLTPSTPFTCVKFANDTDMVNGLDNDGRILNSTCYAYCVEYKYYENVFDETLISRFGLICEDRWLKSFTQTALMFGLVIGVSMFGWISDRYGRRKAYLSATSLTVTFMLALPFAPSYWTFTALRFMVGVGTGGVMILAVIVNIEMVGQKYREIVGPLSLLPDGVGQITLAIIACHSSTWHSLLLINAVISVLLLVLLTALPETPRWLVAQRRRDEAIALMTKVAKFNRLTTAHIKDVVDKAIEDMHNQQKELQKYHLLDLFRNVSMAKITIANIFMWTGAGICFFGLNHYSTLLGLNIFIVVPLMGLLQMLGPFLALPVNKFLGRKMASFCAFCTIGTSMVVLVFIPDGHWGCSATTGVGVITSITLFGIIYTQVNELYPTPLRNMGLGLSSAGSKVGAMIAPFIANTHPHWLASTIFAVVPFLGAVFSLLLPETKGKTLKDTIE